MYCNYIGPTNFTIFVTLISVVSIWAFTVMKIQNFLSFHSLSE
jgi:hypothetical protein